MVRMVRFVTTLAFVGWLATAVSACSADSSGDGGRSVVPANQDNGGSQNGGGGARYGNEGTSGNRADLPNPACIQLLGDRKQYAQSLTSAERDYQWALDHNAGYITAQMRVQSAQSLYSTNERLIAQNRCE